MAARYSGVTARNSVSVVSPLRTSGQLERFSPPWSGNPPLTAAALRTPGVARKPFNTCCVNFPVAAEVA